jgi:hypothetical protein
MDEAYCLGNGAAANTGYDTTHNTLSTHYACSTPGLIALEFVVIYSFAAGNSGMYVFCTKWSMGCGTMWSPRFLVIQCCGVMLSTFGVPLRRMTISNSSCILWHPMGSEE